MIKYLLFFFCINAYAGDNTINIEQIGDNNSITISQDGSGHTATVELGKTTAGSGNAITIDQRDAPQTAVVEIKPGPQNPKTPKYDLDMNSKIENTRYLTESSVCLKLCACFRFFNYKCPWFVRLNLAFKVFASVPEQSRTEKLLALCESNTNRN